MSVLTITCFGSPKCLLDGKEISGFASRKAEALLIYLACNQRNHARESLATLLWDDRSHEQALANLSVLLSSLRKNLGEYLHITRHELGIIVDSRVHVDTVHFEQLVHENYQQAIALYTDDFLSGFALRDASGFEEWLFVERERFQRLVIHALEQFARIGINEGDFREAIASLRRLLVIDPLHEPGYRLLMEALAKDGQRTTAIEIYQECHQRLRSEIDVPPATETTALYELIRNDGFGQLKSAAEINTAISTSGASPLARVEVPFNLTPFSPVIKTPKHNLPKILNNFVGRDREIAEISSLLADEEDRLIELIGPGGIGKTRLAIEAALRTAEKNLPQFADGIWLIELDALVNTEQMLDSMADVLGYHFVDGQRRREELIDYLRQKQLVLLFDNFEHLLNTAPLVKNILEQSPNIVALVTSRERLNITGETVIDITGLLFPTVDELNSATPNHYSAAQLFIDRAQRTDSHFRLTVDETPHLLRICQQLDGVPLAIELAAAWVRTLSCAEIVAELAQSIDFLASFARDAPERHSSLRAVFEHSWRLLNNVERNVLAQLSIFRGGFSRDAAAEIANANLRILVSLLDKSLIRRVSGSRYTIHPLLGQYSAEKLASQSSEMRLCQSRHAYYFCNFLHQRKADLEHSRQLEALTAMDSERENLRSAYRWAIANGDIKAIESAMEAYLVYLDVRCRGIEAMLTAEETEKLLEPLARAGDTQAHRLWGEAMAHHALFRSFEYDNERSANLAEQALKILQTHRDIPGIALSHNSLGLALMQQGELDAALLHFEKAVELRKSLGKDALVASSLINIAQIAWRRGEYSQAEEVSLSALHYAQQSGNPWRIAMVLNVLGILAKELNRYDDAMRLHQQSIETYQAIGNRWGISSIISESGTIAYLQKKYTLARSHFEQSIAIRRDLGNVIHQAGDLIWLGKVAEAQGEPQQAEEQYRLALQLLEPMDEPLNKATAIFQLATLLAQQETQPRTTILKQLAQARHLAQIADSQALVQEIDAAITRLS